MTIRERARAAGELASLIMQARLLARQTHQPFLSTLRSALSVGIEDLYLTEYKLSQWEEWEKDKDHWRFSCY